jgi:hypothetical protein
MWWTTYSSTGKFSIHDVRVSQACLYCWGMTDRFMYNAAGIITSTTVTSTQAYLLYAC